MHFAIVANNKLVAVCKTYFCLIDTTFLLSGRVIALCRKLLVLFRFMLANAHNWSKKHVQYDSSSQNTHTVFNQSGSKINFGLRAFSLAGLAPVACRNFYWLVSLFAAIVVG